MLLSSCSFIFLLSGWRCPTPAAALTLFEVLEQIPKQHPALEAAQLRVRAAQAAWVQAGRWRNPELELRSENLRFHSPIASRQPDLDFFATLTQVIEIGGKPRLRQAVAKAEEEQAEATRARVELELRLSAVALYFVALRSHQEAKVLSQTNQELERLRKIAELRASEGHSPHSEVLKLAAEQSRFQAQWRELSLERDRALVGLQLLLGRRERLEAEEVVEPPLPEPPAGELESLVAQAVRVHPDYQLALASCARAQRQLELEQARQLPDPALTAGYKRTEATDTWVSGVTIPLPLLDTNRANVARAVAEHQAVEASRVAMERELRAGLSAVVLKAREFHERAQRLPADLLQPAATALHAARVAFEEGRGDLLALVDAARVHDEAQRAVIHARAEAGAAGYSWNILVQSGTAPESFAQPSSSR